MARMNRVRPVRLRTSGASMEHRSDGAILVRSDEPLGDYPRVLTERLAHWAAVSPNRICVAKRQGPSEEWKCLTYAQVLEAVRRIGQALLNRGLFAERPAVILSENDLEHFLLMLAGQHVGIPTAHVSPVYSLVSQDYTQLGYIVDKLTPGIVFASSGVRYGRAIEAVVLQRTELVVTRDPVPGRESTLFADLAATEATPAVDAAHERINPDNPAKFLFTSGSTGVPKGVINTHRMICCNLQQIAQVFCFLQDEPPILVDWLPWNHTFGGNHNTGIALYNGGTLYIDDGKPGPGLIRETVRNLREISTTVYFNVPKGYEDLLSFLRLDRQLRETFFKRVRLLFYAGAGMSQHVWDAYRELAVETCGEQVMMVTGLGATETAPMAIQTTWDTEHSGVIGIPIPGVEVKLVPQGDKMEARVRGPNVTPGYWRQPEQTKKAFDEEGFYKFGDAVRFVDPNDVNRGFIFDGRLSEDFKLSTGTWVSVGPLRGRIIGFFAPLVRDVVITGHDRDEVGILIFADLDACRSLTEELSAGVEAVAILRHKDVRARFRQLLEKFAAESVGSSRRVARAVLLEEHPSLDGGEVTDKGTLNQGKVLQRRAALVEELYSVESSPRILRIESR
ncbi:MAG: feruloyl-CoA synthase [Candidatus Acidiferrales bacterium]